MASWTLRIRSVLLYELCCLFFTPLCVGAPADEANHKSLFDGRRWFELHDLVASRDTPRFYQGVNGCAFNETHRCEKELGTVIKLHPKSNEATEAHKRLASLY